MEFIAWDENIVDRCGDRILIDGLNVENYKKNPIVLFNHNNGSRYGEVESKVIGKALNVRKVDGKLFIDILFDEGDEDAAEIKRKVEGGFLNAVSIGFRCIETNDEIMYLTGQKYATITKAELLEISIVELPAHPDAVRQKSYIVVQPKSPAKVEEKHMEEEVKHLKKIVEDLTETVKTLAKSLEEKAVKIQEIETKSLENAISAKSVIDALKGAAAPANTTEDRTNWTYFDWRNKDFEGLKALEKSNPDKYLSITKKLK